MSDTMLQELLGREALAPRFARALERDDPATWDTLALEVGPRVLAFPLLTPAACARLLAELDRRAVSRAAQGRPPNSMHAYGGALADLGLGALARELRERWIAPLATHRFADVGGGATDSEHAFLAEYGRDADEELGFHVDDSAVTLNLCLGGEFSGSELYFQGLRCDLHRQTPSRADEDFELEHAPGTAILHAGRHRHGVRPLRRGRRRNLILWCQSTAAKAAARECQPWCGARSPDR